MLSYITSYSALSRVDSLLSMQMSIFVMGREKVSPSSFAIGRCSLRIVLLGFDLDAFSWCYRRSYVAVLLLFSSTLNHIALFLLLCNCRIVSFWRIFVVQVATISSFFHLYISIHLPPILTLYTLLSFLSLSHKMTMIMVWCLAFAVSRCGYSFLHAILNINALLFAFFVVADNC